MIYLKLLNTQEEYDDYIVDYRNSPNVNYSKFNKNVNYKKRILKGYDQIHLTFVALETGTFSFSASEGNENILQYSIDDGSTWTILTNGSNTPTIQSGNKILWKATGFVPITDAGIGTFSSTGNFNIEGNIMSLIYGDKFYGKMSLNESYVFYSLFKECAKLIDSQNLILPATTLSDHCYHDMFYGCYNLNYGPSLPATTLSDSCYYGMFNDCTSLIAAPELNALNLEKYCYFNMFSSCRSLTTAPELPATTLYTACYSFMFSICTSLTNAPSLSSKNLANRCYDYMFSFCKSLTTAPVLPATTLYSDCYAHMFYYCTSLTTAPVLNATNLVQFCYEGMFEGCSSLNYVKCLATSISTDSTTNWLSGVSASGTFVKKSTMSSWTNGVSGIPSGWTVQNA